MSDTPVYEQRKIEDLFWHLVPREKIAQHATIRDQRAQYPRGIPRPSGGIHRLHPPDFCVQPLPLACPALAATRRPRSGSTAREQSAGHTETTPSATTLARGIASRCDRGFAKTPNWKRFTLHLPSFVAPRMPGRCSSSDKIPYPQASRPWCCVELPHDIEADQPNKAFHWRRDGDSRHRFSL